MDRCDTLFSRDRAKRLKLHILSGLRAGIFALVIITFAISVSSAQSGSTSLDPVFRTYHDYENPVQTIDLLGKQIDDHLPGESLETDLTYLQLSNLYSSIGDHDAATSLLFKLKILNSSKDIETIANALYGLEWAATHKENNETRSEVTSLVLAMHYASLIENLSWRQTVTRHVKQYQFNFLVEHALEVVQYDLNLEKGIHPLRDDIYIILGMFYPERLFEINHEVAVRQAKLAEQRAKNEAEISSLGQDDAAQSLDIVTRILDIKPWYSALLELLKSLAIELSDLDRIRHTKAEVIEAYANTRKAELEFLQGNIRGANRLYRSALGVLKKEKHYHAFERAIGRYVTITIYLDKADYLVGVSPVIDDQIAEHEKLIRALNPRQAGRFQRYKINDYLLRRQVYLDLLDDTNSDLGEYRQETMRQFVLSGDGMRLRPMRHEIQMLGEAQNNELRRSVMRLLEEGAKALELRRGRLRKAQQEGQAREEYRTGDMNDFLELLNNARPGDVITTEGAEPSRNKSITYEGGPYLQLLATTKALESRLYEAVNAGIGSVSNMGIVENWQQIVEGMKPDEVIVSYLDYGHNRPFYAAVISHTGTVRLVDLPSGTLQQVVGWIKQASSALATDAAWDEGAIQKLSESLWFPLEKLPRKITVIPTLSLLGFPFEVLKTKDGKHVIESHDIQYALGLSKGIGRSRAISDTSAAVVVGAHTFERQGLDPLPSSRTEVTQIRTYLSGVGMQMYPADSFPDSPQEWIGIDRQTSVLHVSTHAVWDKSNSLFDTLVFPDKDMLAVEMAFSPLKADLVVFSACNVLTKRADNVHPISGLVTGALSSVAPQLITSLWSVSAGGSSVFMEVFYRKLVELKDPAIALAETKRLLINTDQLDDWLSANKITLPAGLTSANLNHSYYWAPYVLLLRP